MESGEILRDERIQPLQCLGDIRKPLNLSEPQFTQLQNRDGHSGLTRCWVLVGSGCRNRIPQIRAAETTEMHFLTILEAGIPNQGLAGLVADESPAPGLQTATSYLCPHVMGSMSSGLFLFLEGH